MVTLHTQDCCRLERTLPRGPSDNLFRQLRILDKNFLALVDSPRSPKSVSKLRLTPATATHVLEEDSAADLEQGDGGGDGGAPDESPSRARNVRQDVRESPATRGRNVLDLDSTGQQFSSTVDPPGYSSDEQ